MAHARLQCVDNAIYSSNPTPIHEHFSSDYNVDLVRYETRLYHLVVAAHDIFTAAHAVPCIHAHTLAREGSVERNLNSPHGGK